MGHSSGAVVVLLAALAEESLFRSIVWRSVAAAGHHTATLLYNHYHPDWHEQITRITLPTLVVGGRASPMPWTSTRWVAEQIHDSRLKIFEEDEGGGHFMFLENPAKFNALLAEFVSPNAASWLIRTRCLIQQPTRSDLAEALEHHRRVT